MTLFSHHIGCGVLLGHGAVLGPVGGGRRMVDAGARRARGLGRSVGCGRGSRGRGRGLDGRLLDGESRRAVAGLSRPPCLLLADDADDLGGREVVALLVEQSLALPPLSLVQRAQEEDGEVEVVEGRFGARVVDLVEGGESLTEGVSRVVGGWDAELDELLDEIDHLVGRASAVGFEDPEEDLVRLVVSARDGRPLEAGQETL